ncbi:MAG: efflux RND transporter periplasmic adaptor subunit [Deltaproteobacteria bacterium]|nr:MAG: efflux RND transporter periplasmic adaptor subunit [Deltaproteobacteria bacterium]
MKRKRWMIYLGLLIVLGVGITLVIKIKRSKNSDHEIKEISPTYGKIQSFISTTGTVQPQNRLEIKPPIGGRIEEILVREGEEVKVGQILAWMSSTERAALLDAARAQDEKAVKYWQEAYKPTPLIAPIDGEVIVRAVEPGQTVTAFDPIIVLSDRLIVKAQVDETDIGRVKLGQAAIVSLDAYPQVKVKAKIDHISYESMIINNVIIYEVDVLPEEVPEFFRSGMSANVDIIERSKENALLLPIEAVKREKGKNFVLLSQGSEEEPVKRLVELGISDESKVEIVSGVGESDKVLIVTEKYSPLQDTESGRNPFFPFGRRRQQDKKK